MPRPVESPRLTDKGAELDYFPWTRTKLIATLGPATATSESLATLLDAGVDVCRLNFSHGEYSEHATTLARIREWSDRNERPVAVLGDLCGPKIRLHKVAGAPFAIETGATVRFVRGEAECTREALTCTYAGLVDEIRVGQRIFIDDGLIRLLVTSRDATQVECGVTVGGTISSRKGVNLPDTQLSTPALTDKDRRDAEWAVRNGLEYVALSFVRRPEDLRELNALLKQLGGGPGVIVKIEKTEALEHLDELVAESDGVMVARGDLGVEMDVWQVPLIQKSITLRCREANRPVIVATQMLQSMITAPTPTRAEVSDVANAIVDGADAVMLSAESAAGAFPVESVRMMKLVSRAAEAYHAPGRAFEPAMSVSVRHARISAIVHAAVQAALTLDARLVAVWTATGETARMIAGHRLPMPVVALTQDLSVFRKLNLFYGVRPLLAPPRENPAELASWLDSVLVEKKLARAGDYIVVVTSTRPTISGETDTTLVRRIGLDDAVARQSS